MKPQHLIVERYGVRDCGLTYLADSVICRVWDRVERHVIANVQSSVQAEIHIDLMDDTLTVCRPPRKLTLTLKPAESQRETQ